MSRYPQARTKDIIVQEMKDELLVYDLKTDKALCLNETAEIIWKMCDGKTSISEISLKMSEILGKAVTEEIVWLAVDKLREDNLLSNFDYVHTKFNGMSRRQVIRKIGFASVIALPIVSSITAPLASNAQSLNCSSAPFPAGCPFTICVTGAVPADSICNNSCNNVASNCANGTATAMNCGPAPGNPSNQQCDCVCT